MQSHGARILPSTHIYIYVFAVQNSVVETDDLIKWILDSGITSPKLTPSRLPNATGPGARHYAKYWDPSVQTIGFTDSKIQVGAWWIQMPTSAPQKKKNDKTSGFHVTKTRSDCILMDALHDRILMEDQKWWARAAFCSLATLRLLSPCSPMFITDKSKGTLPGTNISPFKRTFESMFFRFSFSLGYLSCLEGTSNSSALLHEQKPTFQTLKASHTAAMDAFCTQNHSAICKIGSNIINFYVFTQELIVYQGRAMPKEHDMISLVSVLLCSLHSPRMFALLRCCWGMVSNDGWLFVN